MLRVKVKQYWFWKGYGPNSEGFVVQVTNIRELDNKIYITTQKLGCRGTIDYSSKRFLEICDKLPWYKQLWYSFIGG